MFAIAMTLLLPYNLVQVIILSTPIQQSPAFIFHTRIPLRMASKAKQVEDTDLGPAETSGASTDQLPSQMDMQCEQIAHVMRNPEATGSQYTGKLLSGDNRGASMINKGVNMAVGILVVGLLTAYLLPIAIDEIVGVDTSAWGDAESSLFDLLPLFFVLAIVLFVVNRAMQAKKGS